MRYFKCFHLVFLCLLLSSCFNLFSKRSLVEISNPVPKKIQGFWGLEGTHKVIVMYEYRFLGLRSGKPFEAGSAEYDQNTQTLKLISSSERTFIKIDELTESNLSGTAEVYEKYLQKPKRKNIKLKREKPQKLNPPQNIFAAATLGDVKAVDKFLKAGVSIDSQDPQTRSPLHISIRFHHYPLMKFLLEKGARLDLMYKKKEPPISWAISSNNSKALDMLLNAGSKMHYPGMEHLFSKATFSDDSLVLRLIKEGIDLEYFDEASDFLALSYILLRHTSLDTQEERLEVFRKLIEEKHYDPNYRDPKGRSLIFYVGLFDAPEIAKFLKAKGAKTDFKDKDGNSHCDYLNKRAVRNIINLSSKVLSSLSCEK